MSQAMALARAGAHFETFWAAGFVLSILLHASVLLLRSGTPPSPAGGTGEQPLSVAIRWTSPPRAEPAAAAEVASTARLREAAPPRVAPAAAPPNPKAVARPKPAPPPAPVPAARSAPREARKAAVDFAPSEDGRTEAGPVAAPPPAVAQPKPESWKGPLLAELRRLIEEHKRYPRSARRRRQEGTVVLRVVITSRGEVRRWEIAEPSAHHALDEAALAAARQIRSVGLDGPGSGDGEVTVVVPLRFSLRNEG